MIRGTQEKKGVLISTEERGLVKRPLYEKPTTIITAITNHALQAALLWCRTHCRQPPLLLSDSLLLFFTASLMRIMTNKREIKCFRNVVSVLFMPVV